jgi:phage host-nuclease inhibitor protein Gam
MNPLQLEEMAELEQRRAELEGFQVRDISSAEWCLRKLATVQAKRREFETLANAEKERLEAWLSKQCEGLDRDIEFFTAHLTSWHETLLREDPKHNKSVKLPHGTLKSRTTSAQAKKLHDDDLLKHIKDAGLVEYIETKESVKWNDYKKSLDIIVDSDNGSVFVIDETGHVVPGVEVEPVKITFKVEVSE